MCYALGITAVDAVRYQLLFERFLAPERDGPPDIDVDIESDRREEVIQYVYDQLRPGLRRTGGQRQHLSAADGGQGHGQGARSLTRSAGRLLQATRRLVAAGRADANAQTGGGSIEHPIPADVLDLAAQIQDFPRHLGIHSGGMVICDRPVAQVCPVEWGRMENRSVLQWDKDDCAAMGLVKFDLLGLGMLSALHYAVDLVREHEGIEVDFATLDLEEPAVYEMLQRADSVGVFQVESRAQMATLPRLKPRTFYDLVVEVALIRPGPIQGGSVHPYIRRRNGLEPVTYDHPVMERSLAKTLGIPLFQEQLMQLAVDVAGFDAGEADQLRRAMGAKRSSTKMEKLKSRLYDGMAHPARHHRRRRRPDLRAAAGLRQLRVRRVARAVVRRAGLLLVLAEAAPPRGVLRGAARAQPMGFYSPQSLVADARRHGVTVRRPDINASNGAGRSGTRTERQTGGPAGAGRDPHHRRPSWPSRSSQPDRRPGIPDAGRADQGGHPDHRAGRGAGHRRCAGRVDRDARPGPAPTGGGRCGRPGGRRVRGPGTLPGSAVGLDAPALPGMSDIELTVADIWATGISPESYPDRVLPASNCDEWGVRTAA